MKDVETQNLNAEMEPNDNCCQDAVDLDENCVEIKASSHASLHSAKSAGFPASKSNNGEVCHDIDAPIPSLDEKLNRLSGHSSMTTYIAWRLASPHLHSPCSSPSLERRTDASKEPVTV